MATATLDPNKMLRPRRKLTGISAVLLPFRENGDVDWPGFRNHVVRTAEAGLIPAVNMDTGYINLIDDETRLEVLAQTRKTLGDEQFVAGAFVPDRAGDSFNGEEYKSRIGEICEADAIPVIFQSFGLVEQHPDRLIDSYRQLANCCDRFIAFELTTDLAPFGAVYDLDTYAELIEIPQCLGAKHSSFHREPEWQRLQLRDARRPDFRVFTGNDLAIDMVTYGSDYLLGLSTFSPELFARRDAAWEAGNPEFYEINDQLQYLGFFAFRKPSPAYKHSAAQFLKVLGQIDCDSTHPKNPKRPASDVEILREIAQRMGLLKK